MHRSGGVGGDRNIVEDQRDPFLEVGGIWDDCADGLFHLLTRLEEVVAGGSR